MAQINPIIASSSDSKQISLVIKGAIVAVAPLMGLVIKAAGGEISNEEMQSIVNMASDFVVTAGSIVSLGMMLFGALRKIYNSFKN